MPKAKINDIAVSYEVHGSGEPVVLISGMGADRVIWQDTLEYLAPHYQVICFDNRGVGESDVPDSGYSTRQFAEDTIDLLNFLEIDKAHVVGNSMGGMITQQLALHYPDRIKSAVIYASRSYARYENTNNYPLQFFVESYAKNPSSRFLAELSLPWIMSKQFIAAKAKVEEYFKLAAVNPNPLDPKAYEYHGQAVLAHDLNAELPKIKVPCLVIGCEADLLIPVEYSIEMAKNIPNARLEIIANAAHVWHVEEPEAFSQLISGFINANA